MGFSDGQIEVNWEPQAGQVPARATITPPIWRPAATTRRSRCLQSIDDGTTSAADIKKRGMSYNWEIRGKKVSGYCNVNGKGTITEFKKGI